MRESFQRIVKLLNKLNREKIIKNFAPRINIAKPEGLIVMKLKAGSPQDIIDVKNLYKLKNIDKNKLLLLAKSARVDKKLKKILTNKKVFN